MSGAATVLKDVSRAVERATGWSAKSFFEGALVSNVTRVLGERLARSRFRAVLEAEDLANHYADIEIGETNVAIQRSFIAARLQFIDDCLGTTEATRATFIDVGDSSGVFLRAIGKRGIGLNYTEGCTSNLMARGVAAVRGDAVRLPLVDDACDYTLCFETLEHLPNPIEAVRELARVSRKGVFVSVPHVGQTTVHRAGYGPAPQPLLHIFELSDAHWRALFSHAGVTVGRAVTAPVVGPSLGLHEHVALRLWAALYGPDVYCGTFRQFQLYYLDANQAGVEQR